MSGKRTKVNIPGFKIDPDSGKYVPIPFNFSELSETQPSKIRKTETKVRKELFKLPRDRASTKIGKGKSYGDVRKSYVKNLSKVGTTIPVVTLKEASETEESLAETKAYPFKSPRTPHLHFTSGKNNIKTPHSQSNEDFLKFEEMFRSPKIINDSPVSSVCNLFENKMMLNSSKKNVGDDDTLSEIKATILKGRQECEEGINKMKELFLEMQVKHENNMNKVLTLISTLEYTKGHKINDNGKENSRIERRSLRLLNKNTQNSAPQPTGSPVILKAGDLRKSALTKSLVYKCQKHQINSPRTQRGLDMYNSTRSMCSALLTPKMSRTQLRESPRSSNWKSNLSMKVQNQCLMLQDTPVHK